MKVLHFVIEDQTGHMYLFIDIVILKYNGPSVQGDESTSGPNMTIA